MAKANPIITFRLSETSPLHRALLARRRAAAEEDAPEALGATIKRDLERYYARLAIDLSQVAELLSPEDALMLCDLSNPVLWGDPSPAALWEAVREAPQARLEEWNVNRGELLALLQDLTPGQSLALVDALERWWLLPDEVASNHLTGLVTVGLQPAPRRIEARG